VKFLALSLAVLCFLRFPADAQTVAVDTEAAPNFTLTETLAALQTAAAVPEFRWDPFLRGGVFNLGGHFGTFNAGLEAGESGYVMFDNREVFTVPLPYHERDELVFPELFVKTLQDTFSRYFEEDGTRFRIAAIIIDPGHGGKDPGAIGTPQVDGKPLRAVEKDIVLNASLRLKSLLDRAFPGKQVLMTRDRDVFYSLEERVAIANSVPLKENEAIIYISIHANYVFNPNARGYEVWYLNPDYRRNVLDRSKYSDAADVIPILNTMLEEEFTRESVMMAQSILQAFNENMGSSMPSRGLKADEWFVVRNSRMPAVLVELGFVSNPEDARIMTSEAGLRKLTGALYKGIVDFVSIFERSGGFTAVQ
jgi:N-acetylmuramoyl-L-alanine amidase